MATHAGQWPNGENSGSDICRSAGRPGPRPAA